MFKNCLHITLFLSFSYCLREAYSTLRCLSCQSYTSQEDCHKHGEVGVCNYNEQRCLSLQYEAGEFKRWYKGCSDANLCKTEVRCPHVFAKCEVHCCAELMCNASSVTTTSMLAVCIFVTIAIVLTTL